MHARTHAHTRTHTSGRKVQFAAVIKTYTLGKLAYLSLSAVHTYHQSWVLVPIVSSETGGLRTRDAAVDCLAR